MSGDSFVTFVVDQLATLQVTSSAMFGGHGLYAGGPIFGIVHEGRLYLKTDEGSVRRYDEAGMGPFQPYDDDRTMGTYREVPPEVLEDAGELVSWAREAIAVAGR